jgi:hypothetical protein
MMLSRQGRNESIQLIGAQNRRLPEAIRLHLGGFG